MPAPILTLSKSHNKAIVSKPSTQQRSAKTRIVRRRGRARDAIDSDDELEREARSDSGSDDENSSIDSDSEVDSVHSGNALRNGHSAMVTPSTTQSPQLDDKLLSSDFVHNDQVGHDTLGPLPTTSTDWSEMVSEENAWASLPVDFNKLDTVEEQPVSSSGSRSRKNRKGDKKQKNREASVQPHDDENEEPTDQPYASTSRRESPLNRRGRSAREAYQNRLQADPSYVPTVGEFWGHDDRLLDKELRSLSGWWRGKWQGRGRGGFRSRGGSFFNGPSDFKGYEQQETMDDQVPPIDRPWGHDGFEEMKKREDLRRQQTELRQDTNRQTLPLRGTNGFRGGRGSFSARGRSGLNRGGFISPRSNPSHSDRPWFAMKPERMWTKQLDWFLHSDPSMKPRQGQGQGFRVKLAGSKKEHVVRTPPRRHSFPQSSVPTPTTRTDDIPHENEDKQFVVRIPRRTVKQISAEVIQPLIPPELETLTKSDHSIVETEESLEDVFTVKPRQAPSAAISVPTASRDPIPNPPHTQLPSSIITVGSQSRSEVIERAVVKSQPHPPASGSRRTSISNMGSFSETEPRPSPPVLPSMQTAFTPQPQEFSASYSYGPSLPPGVAMHPQGMPYEIATGRPVYLQQTPPPLYDPRPMMAAHVPLHAGGVPFVPGHLHHHSSVSPDFLPSHSHSRTPSMNGFIDPMTGLPMFSLPRQNSRIEIRRPTDLSTSASRSPQGHAHRPSGLRTTVSTLEEVAAQEEEEAQRSPVTQYPSIADRQEQMQETNEMEHGVRPGLDPNIMAYQPYQSYYYPEYGYSAYADPSQLHYDVYQNRQNHQPTIYY